MYTSDYTIGVIWSGTVNNIDLIGGDNIQVFQRVRMDEVKAIVTKLEASGVDAIIGTPGTEAEIRKHAAVPIVIAYSTYIDLLETVKNAETVLRLSDKKIALILHEGNPIQVERLKPFSCNQIELFKYRDDSHLRQLMRSLPKNYDLIVGGPTAVSLAESLNIKAYMLLYREQALLEAVEKTREILALLRKEWLQAQRLKTVINITPDGIIATDESGLINMCNQKALDILGLPEGEVMGRKVHQIVGDSTWSKVYTAGTKQTDVLFEYKKTRFFSTRQPIFENGRVIGSVGTFQEAERIQSMERKYRSFQNAGLTAKYTFADIIGISPVMLQIIKQATIYAKFDHTVLIEGETGTGKEIFAQSIHNASPRKSGPFVAINCAALAPTLLESELMGYEEGAFTGAKRGGKTGLFERSHRGTIFLDEINQLPLELQAKLLRVIQEKAVMRIGSDRITPVDVRIIVATNESLQKKVEEATFRSDLYYRVNVLNLHLPPLRERRGDIPLLIEHFLRGFSGSGNADTAAETAKIDTLVAGYHWPGNIRELQNFIERYMILSQQLDDLDTHIFHEFRQVAPSPLLAADPDTIPVKLETLEDMDRQLIGAAVDRCAGNKSRAALLLNISRNTLNTKLSNKNTTKK
ncbi:MAG: sigma 54-interacting transcriptional regulator [Negativicutes bacterium]|nr:sigma 54-interacting transcriptional regulator [Negativicutes bacterium]